MSLDWFYQLSDWNAQFAREVKGRLKPRTLFLTVTTSLLIQLVVLVYFWLALPISTTTTSWYCTGSRGYAGRTCIRDVAGNVLIDWVLWWNHLFQLLSWSLSFILLVAGVYLLISDLAKEERRGTLNFIRLSPQDSQSILLGKLLGVPVVPLLGMLLAVPLHLVAAVGAGIPAKLLLSLYIFAIAIAACYFTGALLFAFLGGVQGWVGIVIVWCTFLAFFHIWTSLTNYAILAIPPYQFYGIPLGDQSLLFWVMTLGVTTVWIWKAVNRRFRSPNATLLSKRQSYVITASVNFWFLGLMIGSRSVQSDPVAALTVLASLNFFWFMLMMAAIMPQRQMLLDWARYRRERATTRQGSWSRSLLQDLTWGEKSPALLAIALNLLITTVMVVPWVLTWRNREDQFIALGLIVLGSLYTLICVAIAQLIMMTRTPQRIAAAGGAIVLLTIMPPIMLAFLAFGPEKAPLAWLFSAFAFAALKYATMLEVAFSVLTQFGIFSLLAMRLTQQLRQAGKSETQALLASSR